jgi:serine/threonine-protein kinase
MPDSTLVNLGRYRLDAHIGEGAMADVYRAYDESIDRSVAIKVLKPEFARDDDLVARFMREARAAGALNHPNIATVYDVGQFEGVTYIAMELVEGVTLDVALQAHGRFPFERALLLAQQMASALEYAHARGVVHRDVKPSNMLLGSEGQIIKLLDFGVARIGADARTDGELGKTQFGQLIGTPRYMSPEQALGTAVDHRSDLFSLGAVLYEIVTGKAAFPGNSLATLAIQVAQKRAEPIEKMAADCPPGFRFIIDKLLAKKPDQRFQSARSLHEAITREVAATSESAPRKGVPLRIKLLSILVLVTGLALWASVHEVSKREQITLERMAAVSGSSIAAFVSGNAGVLVADNAGLPVEQQDWAPLQAFVVTAAANADIRSATIVDTHGIIRAASDTKLVGRRYLAPSGEMPLRQDKDSGSREDQVTALPDRGDGGGLRFVRPIQYAGRSFGTIDLVLHREALDAAIADTSQLFAMLALAVIAVVAIIGYLSGAMVTRPLNRLRRALDDAATTEFALRISHRRRDEFGAAFDAFNRAAAAIEPLTNGSLKPNEALEMTQIAAAPRKAA